MRVDIYQFQPPDIPVTFQIFSDITMMHKFENESQWVFKSGIHSDERHETISAVLGVAVGRCLPIQPLPMTLKSA